MTELEELQNQIEDLELELDKLTEEVGEKDAQSSTLSKTFTVCKMNLKTLKSTLTNSPNYAKRCPV